MHSYGDECAKAQAYMQQSGAILGDVRTDTRGAAVGYADRTPIYAVLEKEIVGNLERAANLAHRVTRIADRIAGAQPQNKEEARSDNIGGNGMLDMLRSVERVMGYHLYDIEVALSRLENDLG